MNLGWYNENELRRYPLSSDQALTFPPDDVIADLSIVTTGSVVRLTHLVYGGGMAAAALTVDGTDAGSVIAANVQPYQPYPILGLDRGVTGFIVFGAGVLAETRQVLQSTPGLLLAEAAVMRLPAGAVNTVAAHGQELSGYVKLELGSDFAYTVTEADGVTTLTLALKPGAGAQYTSPCRGAEAIGRCTPPALRSINDVAAVDGKLILEFR